MKDRATFIVGWVVLFIVVPLLSPLVVLHELAAWSWLRVCASRCVNVRRAVLWRGTDEIPSGYLTWDGVTLATGAGSWQLRELRRVEAWLVRIGSFAAGDEETYLLRVFPHEGPPRATLATTHWSAELEPLGQAGVLRLRRWPQPLVSGLLWLPVGAGLLVYVLAAALALS